jgi:hypothetical protein
LIVAQALPLVQGLAPDDQAVTSKLILLDDHLSGRERAGH